MMKQGTKRLCALLLSVLLLGGTAGTTVFATEGEPGQATCTHTHDEGCGYIEGSEGQPCTFTHTHDGDCGWAAAVAGADCTDTDPENHAHDNACGYVEAKDAAPCAVEAAHTHDAACGYVAAVTGQPCTHIHDEGCGGLSLGQSDNLAAPTQITVVSFDPLPDEVLWQGYDAGTITDESGLTLPGTLTGKAADNTPLTIEGVRWACTKAETMAGQAFEDGLFDAAREGRYTFQPTLPEGYAAAEGVALPEIGVIVRPAGGVPVMPMNLSTDLAVGTWTGTGGHRWVEFGGILWRVLEVYVSDGATTGDDANNGDKVALLLAEESVGYRQFHSSLNNDWNGSDIKAWLNNEGSYSSTGFLSGFTGDQKNAIVMSNYTYGGSTPSSGTSSSSQVFLLSVDDVNKTSYFAGNADRSIGNIWWLRSALPGRYSDIAAYVDLDGSVDATGGGVGSSLGIRPALKINLASGIFSSEKPLYETKVTVTDGSSPLAGARISLSGASAPDVKFSNSNGEALFSGIYARTAGDYTATVTRVGYTTKSVSITIVDGSVSLTVDLLPDASLPQTVYFGQYSTNPLAWQVLDIDREVGKALLLTKSTVGSNGSWDAINAWIANTANGGFLHTDNFTAAEQAAMLNYTQTDTTMFLLSWEEAALYLPDNALRDSGSSWWLRMPASACVNSGGSMGSTWSSRSLSARPAVWVDLTKLCQKDDSGTITLVPTHSATVTVEDADGGAIDGASVTLTTTDTYRTWDGSALTLTGTTASGAGAAFALPAGSYTATATAIGYTQQSGTVTLTVTASGGTATVKMNEEYTKPSVSSVTPSGTGAATSGNIVITFSEAMNPATGVGEVKLNGGAALTGGAWTSGNTVYIVPYSGLANSTPHTIGISGFKDLAGNEMVADNSNSFTTVAQGVTLYTLIVANGTGGGSYAAGAQVPIQADAAPSGKVFDKWVLTSGGGSFADAGSASTTFTMPAESATVTATYKADGGNNGSDPNPAPAYTHRTLQHEATGVTLTGSFTPGAALVVTEKALHPQGDCTACDEIRAKGGWVALYDVSITGSHNGEMQLSLPIDSRYNGQSMTVWHCKRNLVEKLPGTAQNGVVTVTVASLSPFAVFAPDAGNHNPDTGSLPDDADVEVPQTGDSSTMGGWLALLVASLLLVACAAWQLAKRRRAARR